MAKEEIEKIIQKAVKKSFNLNLENISIKKPSQEGFGDYTTNLALAISKKFGRKAEATAEAIAAEIRSSSNGLLEKVETVSPGFINFFLSPEYVQGQVKGILKKKEKFGSLKAGRGRKVNVEFISANPTGPLTIGNGRGGFCGDVLSNILEKAGYRVKREYLINDAGEQIKKLGHSVLGDAEAVYKGKYIEELKERIKEKTPEKAGQKAAEIILKGMIKPTVKKMGIKFDVWFSEKELHRKNKIDKIINWLKRRGLAYEKEGALWFGSTEFGDDKDRVLIKTNGEKTYFASDIAYLKDKFKRGFDKLIFLLGADHYGYVKRMEAAVRALGYKKEQADFIIMQLVRIVESGREIRMSKRKGTYITLDELIEAVGLDVVRFFFLTKSPGRHLNFDFGLAKEHSEKNPVFYIQYAYARIESILRKAKDTKGLSKINEKLLTHPSELKLIKELIRLPEITEETARDYQVQRIPEYALGLARAFHSFYRDCRVITDDKDLSRARLGLILAARIVLKNTLNLMGISSPAKM